MERPLIDSFGRRIEYVRLSVTDRCDLRCRYCMSERMRFLPGGELLTFAEIERLADALIDRGVSRIRLTGGEPLVRRGIEDLVRSLGARIGRGLDELTLTTNATQLARFAQPLFEAGVRRINVSLDSLDPDRFRHITRRGDLSRVLAGIASAKAAGLAVKINMVALAGLNGDEIPHMLAWCVEQGLDLTLIETMPLGEVEGGRSERYLPLDSVRRSLEANFRLVPSTHRTGGPARYYWIEGTGSRLGLITPLTGNFCAGCNRIRVTATGTVYGCLGREQKVELREALRAGGRPALDALLDELVAGKPLGHDFKIANPAPAVSRHMSVTGG
jgi:cyclic pyranopterin phosphate synthase